MAKTNKLGLEKSDYKGKPSTLCKGCGHDSISSRIINVAFEMGLEPHETIKLSGIGCSSKSPAYFLGRSHSFNAVHGRMPSVATGAYVSNHTLTSIGVSGDGDTASIGLGQFKHLLRRNVPMIYIVENNGVYGLTKGQFSATSDIEQELKYAGVNKYLPIDICLEAVVSNCGFVARSFAGDPKQVTELMKAALHHNGTAVIDIISPCVTFNNSPGSTKSYPWGKENEMPLHEISFVPHYEEITIEDYEEGEVKQVKLHDGSMIQLKKVDKEYDPTNKYAAMQMLEEASANQQLVTGLIYVNENQPNFKDTLNLVDEPLATLPQERLRPSKASLEEINKSLR
ncbi:MAG: 2-oxoglutarate ferredoxin oxidoreductase subunit beta [Deltaproteobacteria bacterium]|nr:2-oxoglutarate ferredoxin oxidoreductase subunit beta [Deltaproteobacteria bacterium]|tara:strand:+ start:47354 stop:48376 length:1023 start_codon:yes stop_codon:yes gene_type:complete